ncbi:MAG: radical SAM protein [Nanoarchaeota archaeon]|nr:radical SAM protein [Nanoarchaeota archaeon]
MTKQAWFGRCIFLSWYCERGTCNFCFRSTIKHKIRHAEKAKRSVASILTDAIIGKNLGWKIEFLTGGYGISDFDKIVEIAKHVSEIYGHKIWINLGVLKKEEMEKLAPYVDGICASIETLEPKLHDSVCPDKPIEPYSEMLCLAQELGFKTSMTIVIGLGEKKEDFELLADYIKKHKLSQTTFYALKPVKGTPYTESPEPEYYAWWIEQTRKRFPDMTIMAGLTPRRVDYVKHLLEAGADGVTKFPAVAQFNSEKAHMIEAQAREAGREFLGSLTKLPEIDWDREVEKLDLDSDLKQKIKIKLNQYLKRMQKKYVHSTKRSYGTNIPVT